MGGLRKWMPVTFGAYAVGMLALCGFPLFFSGFWSKDEILHAAHAGLSRRFRFTLEHFGALLTAFYMTRQVYYVFFGKSRLAPGHDPDAEPHSGDHHAPAPREPIGDDHTARDSGRVLHSAWLHRYSRMERLPRIPLRRTHIVDFARFGENDILPVMITSSLIVFLGLALGWFFYWPQADRWCR